MRTNNQLLCLCLGLLFTSCFGTACDITKNKNAGNVTGFNPDCSSSTPYCQLVQTTPTLVYQCVKCLTQCDCSAGDYCSSKPGQIGTCKGFSQYGKSCRPLSQIQVANSTFPDSWKCAITYSYNGTYAVDQEGICIDRTCRYCNYRTNGGRGFPNCPTDNTGKERYCAYPGKLVTGHYFSWSPGVYYENPTAVWLAIFWCFFIIACGIQVALAVLTYRKNSGGEPLFKRESKRDSIAKSKPAEHSTITPLDTQRSSTEVKSGEPPNESQPPPYSPMDVADAPDFKND